MKRDDILRILRERRDELRERFGVSRLALFGSVARDEATDASDVDLIVEFNRSVGLFHPVRTQRFLQNLLHVEKVDVVTPEGIRPAIRERIHGEILYV